MKEFKSSTGGRNVYIEDIEYLQDLALAFSSIFNECDNFIISGCDISGTVIKPGYVYINGKVRYFDGASNIPSFPQYICELNTTENVAYNNGTTQIARNIYGTALSATIPTSIDSITKSVGQYITLTSTGGKLLKDAFFGKYSAILNPSAGTQTIKGSVSFANVVEVNGALYANGGTNIVKGTSIGRMYYDGTNLTVESKIDSGATYKFAITPNGFTFQSNSTPILTLADGNITHYGTFYAINVKTGGVWMSSGDIFNYSDASNDGCLNINLIGYQSGKNYYRNTVIGDGKGNSVLSVTGSKKHIDINGSISINSNSESPFIIIGKTARTDVAYQEYVTFSDSSGNTAGYFGYKYNSDNDFYIANLVGSIQLNCLKYVNIVPEIYENGSPLSDKYYLKKNVYSKAEIDDMMPMKIGVNNVNTLSGLPIDKTIVCATISEVSTMSLCSPLSPGQCLTVVVEVTADMQLPIPGYTLHYPEPCVPVLNKGDRLKLEVSCFASGKYIISVFMGKEVKATYTNKI